MFRVAKATSPMSIGTWTLTGFTAAAGLAATAQVAAESDVAPGPACTLARAASLPAAALGAGLSTYTAALFPATSTPLWAAAPRALAARFGASSVGSGAMALWLGERDDDLRARLETLAAAALAIDLVGDTVSAVIYRRTGVAPALSGRNGFVEKVLATGLGAAVPLGLYAASRLAGYRPTRRDGTLAALAVLAGSALLRVSIKAGDTSARRPDVSFRFMQPDNLPEKRSSLVLLSSAQDDFTGRASAGSKAVA